MKHLFKYAILDGKFDFNGKSEPTACGRRSKSVSVSSGDVECRNCKFTYAFTYVEKIKEPSEGRNK